MFVIRKEVVVLYIHLLQSPEEGVDGAVALAYRMLDAVENNGPAETHPAVCLFPQKRAVRQLVGVGSFR